MSQNQERYFSSEHLDRAQRDSFQDMRARQVPGAGGQRHRRRDRRHRRPLRLPIGQDAAWMLAERARLGDAEAARVREFTQPTSTGSNSP
jgi:hypothetical protein